MRAAGARATVGPRDAGFTLIEVLFALALLSIGIVAVLGSLQNSSRVARGLDGLARAQYLAEEKLAGWRLEPPAVGQKRGRSEDGSIDWDLRVEAWAPDWNDREAALDDRARFEGGVRLVTLTLRWDEDRRERTLHREELLYVEDP